MGKTLRLGFAMGGGVSLGAFSGAALTEAIKQVLLDIFVREKQKAGSLIDYRPSTDGAGEYTDVVIDVFSGASAGAMSLAIMLRGLYSQTEEDKTKATDKLYEQYGETLITKMESENGELYKKLVAAQVAQDLQNKCWVEDIHLDGLLEEREPELEFQGGLFNRGAVDKIAKEIAPLPKNGEKPETTTSLLNDQVLFACTLANLTPLVVDARESVKTSGPSKAGLTDGLRSQVHRDLRVYDIRLPGTKTNVSSHHDRWVLCSDQIFIDTILNKRKQLKSSDQIKEKDPESWIKGKATLDVNDNSTWATICATAIACGAVPFAFEPVPLKRYRSEYASSVWRDTVGRKCEDESGVWDIPSSHVFTYVDGGTFNNEPIREAFRLASFMDAHYKLGNDFERRIIFVDPFVSEETCNLRPPVNQIMGHDSDHTEASYKRASLDRLAPHIGTVVGALKSEARVNEGDQYFQTRDYFKRRNMLREKVILPLQLDENIEQGLIDVIKSDCTTLLKIDRSNSAIPPGTLDIATEMDRVKREVKDSNINDIAKDKFKILLCVYVDLLMNLAGKSEKASVIAIAPYSISSSAEEFGQGDDVKEIKVSEDEKYYLKAIDLMGAPFMGFAGFMYKDARKNDFEVGIHCAETFLVHDKLVGKHEWPIGVKAHEWQKGIFHATDDPDGKYQKDLVRNVEDGVDKIRKRINKAIRQANFIDLWNFRIGFLDTDALFERAVELVLNTFVFFGMKKMKRSVDKKESHSFDFHIYIEKGEYEIDGKGAGITEVDLPSKQVKWHIPENIKGDLEGVLKTPAVMSTSCEFIVDNERSKTGEWAGYYVNEGSFPIEIHGSVGSSRDIKLQLPGYDRYLDAKSKGATGFYIVIGSVEGADKAEWKLCYPVPLEETLFLDSPD